MYTAKGRRKEISRISLSVEGIPPLLGRYEYLIKDEMFTSYESWFIGDSTYGKLFMSKKVQYRILVRGGVYFFIIILTE